MPNTPNNNIELRILVLLFILHTCLFIGRGTLKPNSRKDIRKHFFPELDVYLIQPVTCSLATLMNTTAKTQN